MIGYPGIWSSFQALLSLEYVCLCGCVGVCVCGGASEAYSTQYAVPSSTYWWQDSSCSARNIHTQTVGCMQQQPGTNMDALVQASCSDSSLEGGL